MTTMRLSVQGDKELRDGLRKLGISIADLKDEFEETGEYLTGFFSGPVFVSRGQVIGEPWPALNSSYAAWKAQVFPGKPPLVRSTLMQRSFKHKSTKLSSTIWNESEYFRNHQQGIGVPQRMMMKLDEQRERAVIDILAEGLRKKMRQAGV